MLWTLIATIDSRDLLCRQAHYPCMMSSLWDVILVGCHPCGICHPCEMPSLCNIILVRDYLRIGITCARVLCCNIFLLLSLFSAISRVYTLVLNIELVTFGGRAQPNKHGAVRHRRSSLSICHNGGEYEDLRIAKEKLITHWAY